MPLPEPQIDRRTYREILAEAMARISSHTPEWTHRGDSDPGVTLLQLFAFMTESLAYRANRIPDRNRRKFLRLLGLPMRGASAAEGMVAFENRKGALGVRTLEADREVRAGAVPYRTENGLDVLPITARAYAKSPTSGLAPETERLYRRLHASLGVQGKEVAFYEVRAFEPPEAGAVLPTLDLSPVSLLPGTELGAAVDGADGGAPSSASGPATGVVFRLAVEGGEPNGSSSGSGALASEASADAAPGSRDIRTVDALWLALFCRPKETPEMARQAIARRVLSVGILPAQDAAAKVLDAGGGDETAGGGLIFELPDPSRPGVAYRRLEARGGADILRRPGIVELPLPGAEELRVWDDLSPQDAGTGAYPPSLDDTDDGDRLITWIRIRLPSSSGDDLGSTAGVGGKAGGGTSARLSWIGINAAKVVQRARVEGEVLPRGTGEPDQIAVLAQRPVLVESVELTVNGETWQRIDDLSAAAAEIDSLGPSSTASGYAAAQAQVSLSSGSSSIASRVFTVDRQSGEVRFGDGSRGMRPPRGASILASYAWGGGLQGRVGIGAVRRGPANLEVHNPIPFWGGDEAEGLEEAERGISAFLRHRDRLVSVQDFHDIVWRAPGVDLRRVEVLPLFHPQPAPAGSRAEGVVTVLVVPRHDPRQPDAPRPDGLLLETLCRHLEPRRLITTELHLRGPEYVDVWVSVGVEVVPGRDTAPVLEGVRASLRRFLSPVEGGFDGRGYPLAKRVEAAELRAAAARVPGVAQVDELYLGGEAGGAVAAVDLVGLQLPRLRAVAVEPGPPPGLAELRTGAGGEPVSTAEVVPIPVIPESC